MLDCVSPFRPGICLLTLAIAPLAQATPYAPTPADRAEVAQLLHGFFEAARDGDVESIAAAILAHDEFVQVYLPNTEPFVERQERAIERDVHELRLHFAGGTWVGLTGPFATDAVVDVVPCGRFGRPDSECTLGPVISWRAGSIVRQMRVDRLVRIGGHWKIFDPRI
jgi:hypothetical protein